MKSRERTPEWALRPRQLHHVTVVPLFQCHWRISWGKIHLYTFSIWSNITTFCSNRALFDQTSSLFDQNSTMLTKHPHCLIKHRHCLIKLLHCLSKHHHCLTKHRYCLTKHLGCLTKMFQCLSKNRHGLSRREQLKKEKINVKGNNRSGIVGVRCLRPFLSRL